MGYNFFDIRACTTSGRQAASPLLGGHHMANQKHVDLLKQGIEAWNDWRKEHPSLEVDLSWTDGTNGDFSGIDLSGANLLGAKLRGADFREANLSETNLSGADLSNANLSNSNLSNADLFDAQLSGAQLRGAMLTNVNLNRANLSNADLSGVNLHAFNLSSANLIKVNLSGADLSGADLSGANLRDANLLGATLWNANLSFADFSGANLRRTDLKRATLVETNLTRATLTGCAIYGISVWDVQLEGAKQDSLVITPEWQATITVDNLKIAQFIYLLLNNAEIRDMIDTIAKKAVLILGRFTPERKAVLDALREVLRTYGYVPIVFDFDKPASRDLTGTVSTLAHLARFIIVDLTDPSSAPHEIATVIPHTVVPVQPLILDGEREYSMFHDLRQRYHWVLPTYSYADQAHLLATLQAHVIAPAEQKAQELEKR
jgi:uncharacterized protein YjbI with pentapeptide repeats